MGCMKIEKSVCRLKLKSGSIAFGKISDIKENHVVFMEFSPAAIKKQIPTVNIVEITKYDEKEVPIYE